MAGFGDVPSHMGPFAGMEAGMITTKRAIRVGWARLGPVWVVCLMALWGLAMIAPAALPH
jgi:hypothetical protein